MTNETDETDFEAPRKHYPKYTFKRVAGDKVQVEAYIGEEQRRYGFTTDLEGLDRECINEDNDEELKFVVRQATRFLLEERR